MKLPNAKQAIIHYCLNPNHSGGIHKALVFARLLGLSPNDAEWFREVLKKEILENDAIKSKEDQYGERYIVEFDLKTERGQARVRSTWIILTRELCPRLTSCYIPKK